MSGDSNDFATEPVPDARQVAWLRVALVSAMVAFSLPTFITGIEISQAVSPSRALLALLAGSLLLTLVAALTGSIGARTRLSSYMLARIAFGEKGAALVNLAFALSLLGWFGVNIDLFGNAVLRLLNDVLGIEANATLVELGAGVVMTVTTIYGFRAIDRLSTLLVPVLMVVTALLIGQSLGADTLPDLAAPVRAGDMALGKAISSVVGGVIVGAVILPDITRFIRHWPGAMYTAALSYLVIGFIVMAAGGLASLTFANDDLLDILIVLGLGGAAFAIVIAGSWVLNSLNLYSSVLSVNATVAKLDNRLLTIGLGVVGTAAAFLDILDHFLDFLFYLAIVFVPVAGVIIVDYFLVRRAAYHEARLEAMRPVAPLALLAWGAGALVALLGAEDVIRLSGIAALDAMIVSAGLYYVATRFTARKTP